MITLAACSSNDEVMKTTNEEPGEEEKALDKS